MDFSAAMYAAKRGAFIRRQIWPGTQCLAEKDGGFILIDFCKRSACSWVSLSTDTLALDWVLRGVGSPQEMAWLRGALVDSSPGAPDAGATDADARATRMEVLRLVLASDLSSGDLVESVDRLATWVLTGETGPKPEEPA